MPSPSDRRRLLLTVPGLGVSTAAELYAEIGDVYQSSNANQLIKKAGTNPIVKQTGGGAGSYRKISKQGNDHLRYVVYIAERISACTTRISRLSMNVSSSEESMSAPFS